MLNPEDLPADRYTHEEDGRVCTRHKHPAPGMPEWWHYLYEGGQVVGAQGCGRAHG